MQNDIEKKAFLMTINYFVKTAIKWLIKATIILSISCIMGRAMIDGLAIVPKTYTPIVICVSIFCGLLAFLLVADIIDIIKLEFKYGKMLYELEILHDMNKNKREDRDAK